MSTAPKLTPEPQAVPNDDPLLDALSVITRLHGRPQSAEALAAGLPRSESRIPPKLLLRAAEQAGYSARILRRPLGRISNLLLPAILILKDDDACVLTRIDRKGQAEVILPASGTGSRTLPLKELKERYAGYCIPVQPLPRAEERGGAALPAPARGWFWGTLWRFRRYYLEALLSALLINVLAVATALFLMNVYDRVIPNYAVDTLYVLAIGVGMAIGFEFLARNLRGYFLDTAGKKVDVLLAGRLFAHAMGLKLEQRPGSAGSFASELREFESLRDFITSATLSVLTDLPFIFFFIWLIGLVAGPLYQVPMWTVPVVVLFGLVMQLPLAWSMHRYLRESALRHGLLVESVEGLETLKSLCAEGRMQGLWEQYTTLTSRSSTQTRLLSALVVHFAQLAMQLATVALVIWGVHLIGAGEMTSGSLIAAVILLNRSMAPLSQVANLLARYQHARLAYFMLSGIMKRPQERDPRRSYLQRPDIRGAFTLREVSFSYPGQEQKALDRVSLEIGAGERVGILGRVGSGKSTLLRLLDGLYEPQEGTILLDGADLRQFDPVDLRHQVAWVEQEARLFYGTLRENIALGAPLADDAAILEAARIAGVDRLADNHPMGYDMVIGEGGRGLSGGQRQAVAIARALVRRTQVLLLDEPTSAMDHSTEQQLLTRLRETLAGRTLVLVTHKPTLLTLVERLVVLDGGRVVMEGPRDEVLRQLAKPA